MVIVHADDGVEELVKACLSYILRPPTRFTAPYVSRDNTLNTNCQREASGISPTARINDDPADRSPTPLCSYPYSSIV
jgi:hypothetical protein